MVTPPLVVAHVLLRSAEGQRPGIDVPITAGNLERLTPPPQSVEAVAAHFRDAGFALVGKPGIRLGISGSKKLFEGHFGIRLAQGAGGAYAVREKRGRGAKRGAADPTSIPADNLPPAIRGAVSQIALEAAMSIDQPRTDP